MEGGRGWQWGSKAESIGKNYGKHIRSIWGINWDISIANIIKYIAGKLWGIISDQFQLITVRFYHVRDRQLIFSCFLDFLTFGNPYLWIRIYETTLWKSKTIQEMRVPFYRFLGIRIFKIRNSGTYEP